MSLFLFGNGVGLPEQLDRNLGLELVETLSAEDLKGDVVFQAAHPGTEVILSFPRQIEPTAY